MLDDTVVFEQRYAPDGEKTVWALNPWPEVIRVSSTLLEADTDPELLSHGDGMLRITVANGTALYGFEAQQDDHVSRWRLIRGEWNPE